MTIRGGPAWLARAASIARCLNHSMPVQATIAAIRRLGQPPGRELRNALRRRPGPITERIGPAGRGQQGGEGGRRCRATPGHRATEPHRDAGHPGQQRHRRRERVQLGRQVEQGPGREPAGQHPRAGRGQDRRGAWRRIRVERHQHRPGFQRRQHGACRSGQGRIAGVEQQHRLARRQAEPGGPRIGQTRRAADPRRAQLRHHLPCRIAGCGVRPVASQPRFDCDNERCGEQRDRRPGRAEVRGTERPLIQQAGPSTFWEESVKLRPLKLAGTGRMFFGTKPPHRNAQDPRHPGHAIREGSLTFTGIGLLLTHYLVEEAAEAANT